MSNKLIHSKCCLSAEEREQYEINSRIDREIAACQKRYAATQKIVLLGSGESGKSTLLKQMQIIHGKGFKLEEKLAYRTQIYENILKGMTGLINGKKELRLPWKGNYFVHDNNQTQMISAVDDLTLKMKSILGRFTNIYNNLIEKRENEQNTQNKRIHILPVEFSSSNLTEILTCLWNDDAIQEAYNRRRECPKYFVENVPYYIENIERIGRKDYVPSIADILRLRRATTSINEIKIEIRNVPFVFVDVGGQRTQRQKWHQCFADVTAILFLASSSEYDESLREDCRTNRLDESLKVFETIVNFKHFRNVEFILFLNKHDLLKDKLHKVNIQNYCGDFLGDSTSIADVEKYLVQKFTSLKGARRTDLKPSGSKRAKAHHKSSAFDQINQIRVFEHERGEENEEEKYIYSHFTTAIDTNNIKTIFEMVRLMIFEKNFKTIMLN